ncbi:MAG TPA: DUF4266 domain-containing protein [Archangium sp.]|jgi:hypothetical protein|uniref:DUF4266 domain-containing protein n=1 Tax=Archangium sp. TaxID=1872627 RepID=UPI002ED91116
MRALSLTLLCVLLSPLAGCVRVKPFERGKLASAAMAPPWAEEGMAAEYDAKLLETQTGAGLAGGAPGGGCGCTQ